MLSTFIGSAEHWDVKHSFVPCILLIYSLAKRSAYLAGYLRNHSGFSGLISTAHLVTILQNLILKRMWSIIWNLQISSQMAKSTIHRIVMHLQSEYPSATFRSEARRRCIQERQQFCSDYQSEEPSVLNKLLPVAQAMQVSFKTSHSLKEIGLSMSCCFSNNMSQETLLVPLLTALMLLLFFNL